VGSNPGGGLGSNPGLGTFFDQKNRTRKVDRSSAGVSWGDVPACFASSSSLIGPNLELFTFFAPRPPQDPQATLRSLISLISLCISLHKPYKPIGLGSNPRFWGRGSWVRVPGVEKMEPPRWARDHLGHSQIVFAHQNQGYTTMIRLVFELDPQSALGRPWGPGKPCISLISLCIRVKKPYMWVRTRGGLGSNPGWALFSTKKTEPRRSTNRVRG
jgi:hypothetical protein